MLVGTDITREAVHLMYRNENLIAPGELHLQILTRRALHRATYQACESPDAVLDVHNEIVRIEIGVLGFRRQCRGPRTPARFRPNPTEDLALAQKLHGPLLLPSNHQ